MMRDFVLEIGFDQPVGAERKECFSSERTRFSKKLESFRLRPSRVEVFWTPLRFALLAGQLPDRQPDLDEDVLGPPQRVAFDSAGAPTAAAVNFARRAGVDCSSLFTVSNDSGLFVAARRREVGTPTAELLRTLLADYCLELSERWGRVPLVQLPSRAWLLSMYGGELVPFTCAEISSATFTRGLRLDQRPRLEIADASAYVEVLELAGVVLSPQRREELIVSVLSAAAEDAGAQLSLSPEEVAVASGLAEQPTVHSFPLGERHRRLPLWGLSAALFRAGGGYPLVDRHGASLSEFLVLADAGESAPQIAEERGFEEELESCARCVGHDHGYQLSQYGAALEDLAFHPRLGNFADKTARTRRLVLKLGTGLALSTEIVRDALSAAKLAHCSRATAVAQRYPELRGRVAYEYALRDGWSPSSAESLRQLHSPVQIGAELPTCPAPALVALADRLDTLVGHWAVNATPAGRVDPLEARAQSLGLLRILIDRGWAVTIPELIRMGYSNFSEVPLDLTEPETVLKLGGFLRHRLRGLLIEDWPREVVNPTFEAGPNEPVDLAARVRAFACIPVDERSELLQALDTLANPSSHPGQPNPTEFGADAVLAELSVLAEQLRAAEASGDCVRAFALLSRSCSRLAVSLQALARPIDSGLASELSQFSGLASRWVHFGGLART